MLLLRRSNHVLAEICISRGGLTGTVVDPKLVFGRALAMRAAALVLVHNHPSGNPQPSDHAPVSVDLNWPPEEDEQEEDQ